MDQKMFCYQCQETAGCKGCTVVGVCGKQPDVAAMQDLLVWVTKGISAVTTRLREEGRAVADESTIWLPKICLRRSRMPILIRRRLKKELKRRWK